MSAYTTWVREVCLAVSLLFAQPIVVLRPARRSVDGGAVTFSVAPQAVRPEAAGLWRSREIAVREPKEHLVALPPVERFLYDGRSVILMLMTEHQWMWRTDDNIYRLESKWQGDVLYYRPPFGDFTSLAAFRNGSFEIVEHNRRWTYERLSNAGEVDAADRALLRPRPVHDYSIKPLSPRRRSAP
jgi:hypothetical protein